MESTHQGESLANTPDQKTIETGASWPATSSGEMWYSHAPGFVKYEAMEPFSYPLPQPLPSPSPSPLDQQSASFGIVQPVSSSSADHANLMSSMGSPFYYPVQANMDASIAFTKFNPHGMPPYLYRGGASGLTQGFKLDPSLSHLPSSPPSTPYLHENLHGLTSGMSVPGSLAIKSDFKGTNVDLKREDMLVTPPMMSSSLMSSSSMMKPLEKEKPFKCNYPGCDARFPRMYNLKSHTLCHTGKFKPTAHPKRRTPPCMSLGMWCQIRSETRSSKTHAHSPFSQPSFSMSI